MNVRIQIIGPENLARFSRELVALSNLDAVNADAASSCYILAEVGLAAEKVRSEGRLLAGVEDARFRLGTDRWVEDEWSILVAATGEDGGLAGAAFCHVTWKRSLYLEWLAVHPERFTAPLAFKLRTGGGVGPKMLAWLEGMASRLSLRRLIIESTFLSKGFYFEQYGKRFGWVEESDIYLLPIA